MSSIIDACSINMGNQNFNQVLMDELFTCEYGYSRRSAVKSVNTVTLEEHSGKKLCIKCSLHTNLHTPRICTNEENESYFKK